MGNYFSKTFSDNKCFKKTRPSGRRTLVDPQTAHIVILRWKGIRARSQLGEVQDCHAGESTDWVGCDPDQTGLQLSII